MTDENSETNSVRNLQGDLKQHSFEDVAGSIAVALVEIELFTLPFWLGHAIVSDSGSVSGSLHAWFFVCWGSLAVYIGLGRIVNTAHSGEGWPMPDTPTDALMSLLAYNGVGTIGILLAELSYIITDSFLLSIGFSIFSPIAVFIIFEFFVIGLDELRSRSIDSS